MKPGKLSTSPHCPRCNANLDGFHAVEPDEVPKANDLTICSYCYAILAYTPDMMLRMYTPEEYDELDQETREGLAEAQAFAAKLNEIRSVKDVKRTQH